MLKLMFDQWYYAPNYSECKGHFTLKLSKHVLRQSFELFLR